MPSSTPFPRPLAVALLATLACTFAANHIAARIAFEHATGLLLAVLCRSGVPVLLLSGLMLWRREPLRLPPGTWPWQLLLGSLITVQSLCIYSAVVRIPVALALLVVNVFPLLLVLLTWGLGGAAPSRRTLLLMAVILGGLGMALDLPTRLHAPDDGTPWTAGILFALTAASAFAMALWVTEHRLLAVRGTVRSLLTMLTVFTWSGLLGLSGLLPTGLDWPDAPSGWLALACLALLYGSAFSLLFVWVNRLDMLRNAPVMNMEPIASLFFAWIILEQRLGLWQVGGALVVVMGIVLLTTRKA